MQKHRCALSEHERASQVGTRKIARRDEEDTDADSRVHDGITIDPSVPWSSRIVFEVFKRFPKGHFDRSLVPSNFPYQHGAL